MRLAVGPGISVPELVSNPLVLENLKLLLQAGLVLEVANWCLDLFEATLKISDDANEAAVLN